MLQKSTLIALIFLLNSLAALASLTTIPDSLIASIEVQPEPILVENKIGKFNLTLTSTTKNADLTGLVNVTINNAQKTIEITHNKGIIEHKVKSNEIVVSVGPKRSATTVNLLPAFTSILPPLIAILLALITKEVVVSLLLGLLIGAGTIAKYANNSTSILEGLLSVFDEYIVNAMADSGHVSVIIFSLLIGGLIHVITKNGGMAGVVNLLSKYAKTPKTGQLITYLLGISIFFDDYGNTLIVGKSMQGITDKLKISREKLAYLVDSTAAPIASIAFISTWIGAELGYIDSGLQQAGVDISVSAYQVFIQSVGYSFYPILTLFFMLVIILKQKDFGPMLQVERAARNASVQQEQNQESYEEKPRAFLAIIPIVSMVVFTMAGLYFTGVKSTRNQASLMEIIGNSDAYKALVWSSAFSLIVAFIMTHFIVKKPLQQITENVIEGFSTMLPATVILILAWAMASMSEIMHTSGFLTSILQDSIAIEFIPALVFVLSALISFSTGSSWGTMAILYPLIIPLFWNIANNTITPDYLELFYMTIASVLCGSVMGDHLSPISDTTILSSMASGCNHIMHVRTQMPYALLVGSISFILLLASAFLNLQLIIALFFGSAILYGIVQYKFKTV